MSFDCRGFDEMIQFPYKNENHVRMYRYSIRNYYNYNKNL